MPNLVENCRMSLDKYASEMLRDFIAKTQIYDLKFKLKVFQGIGGWTMRQIGRCQAALHSPFSSTSSIPFRTPLRIFHLFAFHFSCKSLPNFKKQITPTSTQARRTNFRHIRSPFQRRPCRPFWDGSAHKLLRLEGQQHTGLPVMEWTLFVLFLPLPHAACRMLHVVQKGSLWHASAISHLSVQNLSHVPSILKSSRLRILLYQIYQSCFVIVNVYCCLQ